MIKKWIKNIGPGTLVAAAFIGPGTVTLCTLAGVNFGLTLLWAMVLSIIATIVLQEMAARLGIISQKGLSEVIREEIKNPLVRKVTIFLILSAIVIGNAAYEAGNISGGILGLETIVPNNKIDIGGYSLNILSIVIGMIAFILLYIGNYKFLERALIGLVLLMSFSFLITAIMTKPDMLAVLKGS
ncbi:MAG: Nramp family divalent metal transporter, partial [Bacteroidia bacterium]|nr:Nramp family divalent metal transporter [Bacteroidia bacterium]